MNRQSDENSDIPKSDTTRLNLSENGNLDEFLDLFEDVNPSDLHIYAYDLDWNKKMPPSPFGGIISIDIKKFDYIFCNIDAFKVDPSDEIFALGKFEINNKYIGLLLSQWWRKRLDQPIQLLLWDKSEKKIIEGLDLAESYKNVGWYFDKESWIMEYEFNNKLTILTRQKLTSESEDFKTSILEDSLRISDFDGLSFKIISSNQIDTSKYKL